MLTAEDLHFLEKLKTQLTEDHEKTIASIDDYYRKHQYPANSYHLDDWDLDSIEWLPATGPKGPYEKAIAQDNRHFRLMIRNLNANDGKLERDDYYLWLFRNNRIVGRKPIHTEES
jgi:hypothetical protein